MERSGWAPRTFLLALMLGATLRVRAAVGYYPRFSPFFFLCTHHGELEGDGEQGEVLISLHIAGHPTYYVPGQEYHAAQIAYPCTRHPYSLRCVYFSLYLKHRGILTFSDLQGNIKELKPRSGEVPQGSDFVADHLFVAQSFQTVLALYSFILSI
ncbi:hypothetical protein EI555_015438 [Monodon monoceros]|uniref:Reelin domain-containing protein n=1 Tax=Monodon monoceros TaxID=40151 RepID=A0A4U1FTA6_MONMO|nr:hypothetical protein EI555_015438 [Monodon monoceros]